MSSEYPMHYEWAGGRVLVRGDMDVRRCTESHFLFRLQEAMDTGQMGNVGEWAVHPLDLAAWAVKAKPEVPDLHAYRITDEFDGSAVVIADSPFAALEAWLEGEKDGTDTLRIECIDRDVIVAE